MPILDAIRMYPKNILLAMGARFAENGFFYIYATFTLAYATQALGMKRQDLKNGVLIAAATGGYFRRSFLSRDVVPDVHAARNQKPATRLDRDRPGPGCGARRHVWPAGELLLRTVRDESALQRRVAWLQSCVDLRRSAVAAHRCWAHDRLQAGDVADLRLYDRPGANHDRFGLFREGNAEEPVMDHPALPFLKRDEKGKSSQQPTR